LADQNGVFVVRFVFASTVEARDVAISVAVSVETFRYVNGSSDKNLSAEIAF
jgi:hypothetical protein